MSTDPHIARCAWCGQWMLCKRKRRKPQYCSKDCRELAKVRHSKAHR